MLYDYVLTAPDSSVLMPWLMRQQHAFGVTLITLHSIDEFAFVEIISVF